MALKGFLSGLFAVANTDGEAAPKAIDPKTILFSVPTISDDISSQEPAGELSSGDLVFHEDDWRQLEFYPANRLDEVKQALSELKKSEAANRVKSGWRNVYVRRLRPASLFESGQPSDHAETLLGIGDGPAPVLFTGVNTVTGRIAQGFTLHLGPKAWLYGARAETKVVVLGAQMEQGAEDRLLVEAFAKLSGTDGLIFVDWRQQLLLTGVSADGKIIVWRP